MPFRFDCVCSFVLFRWGFREEKFSVVGLRWNLVDLNHFCSQRRKKIEVIFICSSYTFETEVKVSVPDTHNILKTLNIKFRQLELLFGDPNILNRISLHTS